MHRLHRFASVILAVIAPMSVAACSQPAASSPTAAASNPTQSTAPAAAASPASSAPAASPATGSAAAASPAASPAASSAAPAASTAGKVNANTASVPELQAAFEAAGVTNAVRWAREVEEYRPYPTNDPSFAKLRQELAKYNPAPDVLEKILASLTL